MKLPTKKYFHLEIDDVASDQEISAMTTMIINYPCSEWEVSCILVPVSTTKMFVEFKKYLLDGKQVVESHYVTRFLILEL